MYVFTIKTIIIHIFILSERQISRGRLSRSKKFQPKYASTATNSATTSNLLWLLLLLVLFPDVKNKSKRNRVSSYWALRRSQCPTIYEQCPLSTLTRAHGWNNKIPAATKRACFTPHAAGKCSRAQFLFSNSCYILVIFISLSAWTASAMSPEKLKFRMRLGGPHHASAASHSHLPLHSIQWIREC